MKSRIFSAVFIFFLIVISGQKLSFETILKDKISIRAIEIWDGKVYYSGTDSKFGFVSLKDSADKKQMKLSDKKLQFRTLAQDKDAFYTINIESPAYFFSIDKKTLKADVMFSDFEKNAFYDALHFTGKEFYTFSDPEEDFKFKLINFRGSGEVYGKKDFRDHDFYPVKMKKGEAAFAASNSNIASSKNFVWIATGGLASRIFRLDLKNDKIEVFDTPFIQGTSSQGIYSIDFFGDKFGIAVGGDYTKQNENIKNIATTFDAGKTWQIQASGKNSGYKTCVKIRPGSKGKEIIAVGDQNIEFSNDYGKTWSKVSDEKNLYTCTWVDKNTLVFAGKDRVLKAKFSKL